MIVENRRLCHSCENSTNDITFTESNRDFLLERIKDGNINEAITIRRIAWDHFSVLKESAEQKTIGLIESHWKKADEVSYLVIKQTFAMERIV